MTNLTAFTRKNVGKAFLAIAETTQAVCVKEGCEGERGRSAPALLPRTCAFRTRLQGGRPREQGQTLVKIHVFIYVQYKSGSDLLF